MSVVPRPRPGYESPDPPLGPTEPVAMYDLSRLVAAVIRQTVGAVFFGMSTLVMPVQMWTPVMGGVGVLMVVGGASSTWRVGVDEHRLKPYTRVLLWIGPAAVVIVTLLMFVLGPAYFWETLTRREVPQDPASFVPAAADDSPL